jgi:nicotinamide-nucleotide amidase
MILDEGLEERIAGIVAGFARRLRFDPEAMRAGNRKQAMVPEGAITIDPAGTAPGLVVPTAEGPTIVVMPGPPRELHAMWPQALATSEVQAILARAEPYRTRVLRLFGIPESEIAKALREIGAEIDLGPLEVTTCLRRGELELEIRHRPGAEDAADHLADEVAERYGRFLFSADGSTIDEQLAALLRGRRIALAESSTGGMLAARLAGVPGASAYLAGGVVAYSNESKAGVLGVDPALIERNGAVSPEVAEGMAAGALERFDADVACSITGIAGPGGGTDRKPVGYTCICALTAGGESLVRDPVIPGDRAEIRERAATVAMHILRRLLRGEKLPL